MDERYQIAENKCVEKILDAAFKDWSDDDPTGLKGHIVRLLEKTVRFAFSEGYDIGYCNGVDDIKDID